MGAPLAGVDVVGEGEHLFLHRVREQHRHFHGLAPAALGEVDRPLVERFLPRRELLHERGDPALGVEGPLHTGEAVVELDREPGVEVGELLQPVGELGEVVVDLVEDLPIGEERDRGACLVALAHHLKLGRLPPPAELLAVDLPIPPPHLDHEVFGQGVHRRYTHPVEPPRHLVPSLVKFPPGVKGGEHELDRAHPSLGVDPNRDPSPVVADGDPFVLVDHDLDRRTEASKGFVHRVVDDLVDHLEEAIGAGGADVHPRPLADRIDVLQHLDLVYVVA